MMVKEKPITSQTFTDVVNGGSKVLKTKVTNLDNLKESIQQKLVVDTLNYPIFHSEITHHSNSSSYFMVDNVLLTKFPAIYNRIKKNRADSYVEQIWKFTNTAIFTIKNTYFQDDFYIFESTDNIFYHVNMKEFDEKGLSAKSFKSGKPTLSTPSNLVGDFVLNNTGSSIQIIKAGNIKSTLVGELISVVDKSTGDVVVVNKNRFEFMRVDKDGNQDSQRPIKHPFGHIEKMRIDNNSNFLLIISKYEDNKTKLHFINRKTLERVWTLDDIVDIIQIDNKDDLNCLDKDGKIIYIDTNFDQFSKGYVDTYGVLNEEEQEIVTIEDRPRSELQEALKNGAIKIDINGFSQEELVGGGSNSADDDKLRENIRELVLDEEHKKTLRDLYKEADTEVKADVLRGVINKLKSDSRVGAVKGILDPIESAIFKKRSEIKINILWNQMKTIIEDLGTLDDLVALIGMQSKLEDIKKKRSQIIIGPGPNDKQLQDTIKLVIDKIKDYRDNHKEDTLKTIDDNLVRIQEYLDNIEYLSQLTSVFKTELWMDTENIIKLLGDEDKKTYDAKINNLFKARQKELSDLENKKKTNKKEELAKKVEEIKANIGQLESIMQSIDDEATLKAMKKSDPLVLKIIEDIGELSDNKQQELQIQLDNAFQQRIFRIKLEHHESKGVIKSLDEYGIDTLLYYSEADTKKIKREIQGVRDAQGKVRLQIDIEDGKYVYDCDKYFKDPDKYAHVIVGNEMKFEMTQSEFLKYTKNLESWRTTGRKRLQQLYKNLFSISQKEERTSLIEKILSFKKEFYDARYTELLVHRLINQTDVNTRPFLARFDPRFIILDEEKVVLNELSARLVNQKEEKRGIDILEGGPGLGKTEMCKFIAAVTNREIIRIQCSKMDPADMFFSPQLKKGETTREPADWIKLMQKPGTLIVFDEIDKLNDQCFERLHSLFDGDKSIYDPQTGRISANPDCLFLGTRNSYEKMGNPIVSRSRIQMIEYPSMQNEAYKVSKYANNDFLDELSYLDFVQLREKYTVQSTSAPKNANERKIYDIIINIKHLLNIFTELRKKYDSDSFDDKFEYELSYRDAHHIFIDYNADPAQTFKKSIKDILIPKVRAVVKSKEDKDLQKSITDKVIDVEIGK